MKQKLANKSIHFSLPQETVLALNEYIATLYNGWKGARSMVVKWAIEEYLDRYNKGTKVTVEDV